MIRKRQPAAETALGPEDLRIASPDGLPTRMMEMELVEALEHGSQDLLTLGVALVAAGGAFGVTLLATSSAAVWVKVLFITCAVVGLVNGSLLLYLWRRSRQKTASLAQKIRQRIQRIPPDDLAIEIVPRESATIAVAEPRILVDRIQSLLASQDLLGAQREASRAAEMFPDHPWLEKAGRVLNPTRVASVPASGPDRTREFDWLSRNSSEFRGKWVALLADDLIATADDFDALLRQVHARQIEGKPLVHRIG